jgi:hypothetical protein
VAGGITARLAYLLHTAFGVEEDLRLGMLWDPNFPTTRSRCRGKVNSVQPTDRTDISDLWGSGIHFIEYIFAMFMSNESIPVAVAGGRETASRTYYKGAQKERYKSPEITDVNRDISVMIS